jgi:hypothetical protein
VHFWLARASGIKPAIHRIWTRSMLKRDNTMLF